MVDKSMTASRTGGFGHNQGGDALLEEVNKNAKAWIIGVPTNEQWERSFRNLDILSEVQFFKSKMKTN